MQVNKPCSWHQRTGFKHDVYHHGQSASRYCAGNSRLCGACLPAHLYCLSAMAWSGWQSMYCLYCTAGADG
jgi:hypothetical protein